MTAVAERPHITEAESPEEWAAEVYKTAELKESTSFIDGIRKAEMARWQRDRREIQLAREAREAEDALQELDRERIAAENAREAAKVLAQTCQSCFCIHAGEC